MGSSRPHELFKSPSCNLHTSLYPADSQSASGSQALHANRFPFPSYRSVSVFGCSQSSLRITIHYAGFFFLFLLLLFFLNNNPWVCFSRAVCVVLSKLWNQLLFKLTDSQFRLKHSHSRCMIGLCTNVLQKAVRGGGYLFVSIIIDRTMKWSLQIEICHKFSTFSGQLTSSARFLYVAVNLAILFPY